MLEEEHKNILKVAKAIEIECNKLKSGRNLDKEFFKKAVYFIKNYADKFHHAKEEEILFKEMLKDSVQECLHCNPIDQMLHEHGIGRDFIKNLEEGIKTENKEKIIKNAMGYAQLIREHIFKEDNILYPMCDETLGKKTKDSMLNKFEKEDKSKEQAKKRALAIVKEFEKRWI